MFGQSHKKSETPTAPWAFQFLTTDYADYRQPLSAVFYAGPYFIIGHYLADPAADGLLFRDETNLRPLADAEIICQWPGSTLTGWRVPWRLLNARQLHSYRLL